ncbi:MAG TPA: hypothetical protein VFY71_11680 [Planctomycetota bacterium]|nr:hypothetical protein [Planctomycetota bacterium]
MKRALLLLPIAAAAGLVWWLASDAPEAAPPAGEFGSQRAAPAQPAGFAAEAPPPRAEEPPAPSQELAPAAEPQPQRKPPPTHYAGIVVRKADGTLLDNVTVQALDPESQPLGRKGTQQGRFEFGPDVLTGRVGMLHFTWRDPRSEARGDNPVREVSTRVDPATLNMPPDQIKVELDTGWIIRGKVVDEDNEAITAATVRERDLEVARSRLDGTFIARDFDPTLSPVRLVVEGNGWATATADVAAPANGSWVANAEVVLAHFDPGPDPTLPAEPRPERIRPK